MNDFYIINNDDKLRKLYLKLKVLLIIKKKKVYIENKENKKKEEYVKKEESNKIEECKEENNEEYVKKEENNKREKKLIALNKEENVNVIKENLNGTIKIDVIVNELEEISEEEILKKKLDKGKEDLDVGCVMFCRGCGNIIEYINYHINKRCVYIKEKIKELIYKKED